MRKFIITQPRPLATMRVFFAIDIAPQLQCAIEKWRDRTVLAAGRVVPAANFHITLHFLGDIAPRQLDRLCVEVDQVNQSEFELRLDTPGFFPAPGIFWIGAGDSPVALAKLVKHLQKASKKIGVKTPRKSFTPHLTLFRGCRAEPPLPTQPPDFNIACDGFALFESITGRHGVRYQSIRRWSLKQPLVL